MLINIHWSSSKARNVVKNSKPTHLCDLSDMSERGEEKLYSAQYMSCIRMVQFLL